MAILRKSLKIAEDLTDRRAPLALMFALILQGATAVWWASAQDRAHFFLEQRVTILESGAARAGETQSQTIERLARIEERLNAQIILLDRIEKRIGTSL